MAGVYGIRNKSTSKIYVGQTTRSFEERWSEHRWDLDRGRHGNRYLQSAWNKYTAEDFEFLVLEVVENLEELSRAETFWLRNFPDKYNLIEEEQPVRILSLKLRDQIRQKLIGQSTGRSVTGGKTYDEYYGEERSRVIRSKQSQTQKLIGNHPPPVQKGSTYEERFGPDRAREEREKRCQGKLRTHRSRK